MWWIGRARARESAGSERLGDMIRAGLQIPNFTYPDVAPDQLFERVSDIATTAETPASTR